MAELDGLDATLRDALARAARPGDPTGVADAIRSRVAAGDPGTSVAGPTAPGWSGGVRGWLPWLGLVVAAGIVGGVLGVSGVGGRPAGETVVDVPVALGESAPASACVDGPVIGRVGAGTRVLAVARSEDASWVGVRDPGALGGTVWMRLGDVSLDDGAPALEGLPVGGDCPEAVVVVPVEPEPEPTEEPEPGPGPAPGDTTPPMIGQQYAAPSPFYTGESTTVHAVAADDTGVSAVSISWSGAQSGSGAMTRAAGNEWVFTLDPNDVDYGPLTFTLVARDAAGNTSTPVTVSVSYQYFG